MCLSRLACVDACIIKTQWGIVANEGGLIFSLTLKEFNGQQNPETFCSLITTQESRTLRMSSEDVPLNSERMTPGSTFPRM
jgi:hypothetical protein